MLTFRQLILGYWESDTDNFPGMLVIATPFVTFALMGFLMRWWVDGWCPLSNYFHW